MKINRTVERSVRFSVLIAGLALMTGCTFTSRPRVEVNEIEIEEDGEYSRNASGVVEYVWEEPMVDVVQVPPGLDPEGHYYRPAHHEIVEVRQGRWQYYKQRPNR